ncbi:phBC6A51 family helix-turn-helix protein [Bacillus cereus]|uniref:phBC6A51 family helix-turn-helix protein n=1 Tax=Bacillus cereus TaxID=1396 RepID=UPI000BFD3D8C|nr:phBC6A51 family helix-turn-helix protein [Bacillus cereus]MDM5465452.1 phBC6A51 family helix-turn-helix protein [Bacillus cereus]PGN52579.1 hypothetical protein CN966_24700 [Bacillus cereus]
MAAPEKKNKLTLKQMTMLEDAYHRQRGGERLEDIATDFGISRKTLYTWKQKNQWKVREREIRNELASDAYEAILENLVERALKGSVSHARLYMDVMGKLRKPNEDSAKKGWDITKNGVTDDFLADIDELLRG